MDDGEKKALADIEAYGCHVIHVLEDNDDPPFSYSVGVGKTSGAPEVIVIGLKQPIAHFIVNEYNDRVRNGERFVAGQRYDGFLAPSRSLFARVRLLQRRNVELRHLHHGVHRAVGAGGVFVTDHLRQNRRGYLPVHAELVPDPAAPYYRSQVDCEARASPALPASPTRRSVPGGALPTGRGVEQPLPSPAFPDRPRILALLLRGTEPSSPPQRGFIVVTTRPEVGVAERQDVIDLH
jgi:hypothetical protein